MDPISIAMSLAQFAPAIIRWVTGSDKAAEAAGTVVEIAKQVTGKETGDAALGALQVDPALQVQFRTSLLRHESEMDSMYLADRQDARARDVALVQAGVRNRRADIMVLCAALGLLACLGALVFYRDKIPGEAATLIGTIASIFGLCLRDAFQFEFGSSRGSQIKDETLKNLIR